MAQESPLAAAVPVPVAVVERQTPRQSQKQPTPSASILSLTVSDQNRVATYFQTMSFTAGMQLSSHRQAISPILLGFTLPLPGNSAASPT